MSLIQEALKRQQQEMGEGDLKQGTPPSQRPKPGATPPPPPPAAAMAPPPPPAPAEANHGGGYAAAPETDAAPWEASPKKKKKQILLMVFLFLCIGVAFAMFTLPQLKKAQSRLPAVPPPPESAIPPETPTAEPKKAEPKKPSPTKAPVAKVPAPKAAPTPVAPPEEPEEKVPVVWPTVTVNGIVGSGANGSVLLNGQIVPVGESLLDVKVLSIERNGVKLEYQGETQTLRQGGTTQ